MSATRELEFLRFLADLTAQVEDVQEPDKVVRVGLRLARDFFQADAACIAERPHGPDSIEIGYSYPPEFAPDPELFRDVLDGEAPRVGHNPMLVAVERRGRPWAVLGFWRDQQRFDREALRQGPAIAKLLTRCIAAIDRQRGSEVRARIDRKMMEQLRPKDLFYEVLEGLRTLTRYDHSAGLLVPGPSARVFELVAEKIAWRKGKGRRVGLRRIADQTVLRLMEGGGVSVFERDGDGWRQLGGAGDETLARFLDYDRETREPDEELEGALLCAPLVMGDAVVGVLKVAARSRGLLGAYEVELVRRFLPQVAIAIRRMEREASLETGLLEAEKKHAIANLARGVAHDINNALGAVLPLVQQLRTEACAGELDVATAAEDLARIEASVQVCQRIFGGMLSFAKSSVRGVGEGNVRRAIESTLAILGDALRRQAITVTIEAAPALSAVRGGQGDLEQLVLNLASNARDAMPEGGTLSIRASSEDGAVVLEVADTGVGMDAEVLAHVQEPFFSTKRHGNGLGLSICRSIVWNMRGRLEIDSAPGAGTRVRVRIPIASLEAEVAE